MVFKGSQDRRGLSHTNRLPVLRLLLLCSGEIYFTCLKSPAEKKNMNSIKVNLFFLPSENYKYDYGKQKLNSKM